MSIITAFILSTKLSIIFLFLEKYLVKNWPFLFLRWNIDGQKLPELFLILTHFIFQTHVLLYQRLDFLLQCLSLNFLNLCWILWSKISGFLACSGTLEDQNSRKSYWSWDASVFNFVFRQVYLLRFSIKVSIDSFLLAADDLFQNVIKFVFNIGIGILIVPVSKCYQCKDILIYLLIFLKNCEFEFFFLSRSSLRVLCF